MPFFYLNKQFDNSNYQHSRMSCFVSSDNSNSHMLMFPLNILILNLLRWCKFDVHVHEWGFFPLIDSLSFLHFWRVMWCFFFLSIRYLVFQFWINDFVGLSGTNINNKSYNPPLQHSSIDSGHAYLLGWKQFLAS